MASTIKQNLRYAKAAQKLLKKVYPKDKTECQLVKLNGQYDDLSNWICKIWQRVFYKNFRPSIDNENPLFFDDFDELAIVAKRVERVTQAINMIEIKTGVSLESALLKMYQLNAGCSSQSY
ncbi:hypothetical protein EON73_04570 [bacterium]|nr:MAG: hypothetical protein EON73_04570 [bacterium]